MDLGRGRDADSTRKPAFRAAKRGAEGAEMAALEIHLIVTIVLEGYKGTFSMEYEIPAKTCL
jgi:hypothetical protein